MEDYKELIEELKSWLDDTREHEIPAVFYIAVCKAVQAIEQLVKEREKLRHILQTRPVKTEVITFDCCNDGTNWGW